MTNPFLNVSTAFTDKFFNLDRILFKLSPYLTEEESWKILDTMELAAQSKYEGNWTEADCWSFLRDQLGADRVTLITMMEAADKLADQKRLFGQ
jgi:hypothetical protein